MLHFVIEITYTAPLADIDRALPAHRAFLQGGYDRGLLLMSGPQNPRTGGILVARATSHAELEAFLNGDPYQVQRLAAYRFIEFNPVKRQPLLENWCGGA
jgi:uncharacterized protein YciI